MALAAQTTSGGRRRRGGRPWRGGRGRVGRGGYKGRSRRTHSSGLEFELASSSGDEDVLYCYGDDDLSLTSGGYDCDFVNDVTASLQCLICTLPARDPQQVSCCGKIFCLSCLDILKKSKSNSCPKNQELIQEPVLDKLF